MVDIGYKGRLSWLYAFLEYAPHSCSVPYPLHWGTIRNFTGGLHSREATICTLQPAADPLVHKFNP